MGRYMRKAKNVEVAVMEVQQSSTGVRTRAKTLALQQRMDKTDSLSYLELRSRRLEKPASKKDVKVKGSLVISKDGAGEGGEEVEVSFGENVLDLDARNVRETTPCFLIRNSDSLRTPESTTRRSSSKSTNGRMQNLINRNIPTTNEMEEFFCCAEKLQQSMFTEKYNFDPVNDCPLPGRYEWVKVE